MKTLDAAEAGTFAIGGDLTVNRLGFGAMRLTGPGIWGPPRDREGALQTLRRLPELGVNFIDTADSYGPDVSESLIREALHPYGAIHVATKGGLTRPGPDQWRPHGDPDYLVRQAEGSRERLESTASTCGSFTASIPTCRARPSSRPSPGCSTAASSAAPGSAR